MPWLSLLIFGPLLPAALLELVSSPSPWLVLGSLSAATVLAVAAWRVGRGLAKPTPAYAWGGAAATVLLTAAGAAGGEAWFPLALGWSVVALAGVLTSRLRTTGDLVALVPLVAAGVLAPIVLPDSGALLALAMATALATSIGIGMQVRSGREQAVTARRQAVAEERADMARELHDLVAHEVTGIVVLAQAAAAATPDATTADVLRRIERSGQDALAQIRAMVQTLRGDDEAQLQPTGGGSDAMRALVAEFAASSEARVDVRIDDLDVDPATDAALQRVLAEGLTNVRRHAGAVTTVEVRVAGGEDGVRLRIVNDGSTIPGIGAGSGFGLVGARERLERLGGRLDARRDGDRWILEADLPLADPKDGAS